MKKFLSLVMLLAVSLFAQSSCWTCSGSGRTYNYYYQFYESCRSCNGTGIFGSKAYTPSYEREEPEFITCSFCTGTGRWWSKSREEWLVCDQCNGNGRVLK
jgi:DnaJ-class molecular chaperone